MLHTHTNIRTTVATNMFTNTYSIKGPEIENNKWSDFRNVATGDRPRLLTYVSTNQRSSFAGAKHKHQQQRNEHLHAQPSSGLFVSSTGHVD